MATTLGMVAEVFGFEVWERREKGAAAPVYEVRDPRGILAGERKRDPCEAVRNPFGTLSSARRFCRARMGVR